MSARPSDLAETYLDCVRGCFVELVRASFRTRRDLGTALGRSETYVSRILNGRTPLKLVDVLAILIEIQVSPDVFFREVHDAVRRSRASRSDGRPADTSRFRPYRLLLSPVRFEAFFPLSELSDPHADRHAGR